MGNKKFLQLGCFSWGASCLILFIYITKMVQILWFPNVGLIQYFKLNFVVCTFTDVSQSNEGMM